MGILRGNAADAQVWESWDLASGGRTLTEDYVDPISDEGHKVTGHCDSVILVCESHSPLVGPCNFVTITPAATSRFGLAILVSLSGLGFLRVRYQRNMSEHK